LRSFLVAGKLAPLYADAARRGLLKPEAVWEIEQGQRVSAHEVYRASCDRSAWYEALRALFERHDFLVLPSAQVFPFDADWTWPREVAGRRMTTYHQWMEVVTPATLAGLPALSVPVGFSPGGLPMGMQIIGRRGDDAGMLRLAEAYHQATDWPGRHPPAL
jgi:amidase